MNKKMYDTPFLKKPIREDNCRNFFMVHFQLQEHVEIFFTKIFESLKHEKILWILDEKMFKFKERLSNEFPSVEIISSNEFVETKKQYDHYVIVSDLDSLYDSSKYSLLEINNVLDKYAYNLKFILDQDSEATIPEYTNPQDMGRHINDRSRIFNSDIWDRSSYYVEIFQCKSKLYAMPLIMENRTRIRINLNEIKDLGYILTNKDKIIVTNNELDLSILCLENP